MSHPQDFESLWRASAHEAVPHTDLFPEALLVLPELTDNSISANATKIELIFKLRVAGVYLHVKIMVTV